jgi:peptide/nickel transport system substrate-binding protein
LLDEAGYPRNEMGKRFSFRITYMPEKAGINRKIAEYLRQLFLRNLGVETIVEHPEDFKAWVRKVAGWDFDATLDDVFNWGDPVIGVHRTYLSSNIRKGVIWSNTQGYSNPEVDSFLEQAGSELDFQKRYALYAKFRRLLPTNCRCTRFTSRFLPLPMTRILAASIKASGG